MWECDRQNETSQQKMLGRQSILLTKVYGYSPLSMHVEGRLLPRKSQGSVDTHSQRPPDDGLCCLFYDT